MTRTTYRQLQPEERMRIEIWKAENVSLRDMSRRLGRAPSTVSRELSRNASQATVYSAATAQVTRMRRRQAARPTAKLSPDGVLWGAVREMLAWKWSPQEIAATEARLAERRNELTDLEARVRRAREAAGGTDPMTVIVPGSPPAAPR